MGRRCQQKWVHPKFIESADMMFPDASFSKKTELIGEKLMEFMDVPQIDFPPRGRKGKRGSVLDIFFVMAGFFTMCVIILIMFTVVSRVDTEVQGSDFLVDEAKTASTKMNSIFGGLVDQTAVFLFFMALLASIIFASLILVHPIFFIPYIVIWIFSTWLSAVVSDIYLEVAYQAQLAAATSQLPFITHIFLFLPYIIFVFGLGLAVIMFKTYQARTQ